MATTPIDNKRLTKVINTLVAMNYNGRMDTIITKLEFKLFTKIIYTVNHVVNILLN